MTIQGFDRPLFERTLKEHLSPTTPIRSPEFLRGREKKLEDIRRSLVAPGRHIFVYGDRGVGKTSLAQTAAYQHQSADQSPVLLTCDPSTDFYRLARDLAVALTRADPTIIQKSHRSTLTAGWKPLISIEVQKAIDSGAIPEMRSINEVIAIIDYAARRHSCEPVAVIDEFERIKSDEDRMLFADLIKQLGDQSIPLKLIFCGVGSSLDELLDSHHSCYRYLTTVSLERLSFEGRLEIIESALNAFNLSMDDTTRYRIAKISDRYPHFVHLVGEKLFWEVFGAETVLDRVRPIDFTEAISNAVLDIEARLRSLYEKATKKYNNDYEEVLWAVADDQLLSRRSSEIFISYARVCSAHGNDTPLNRERFNQRMNALKQPGAGSILTATRTGWYSFTENMVRGYVRLRAEQQKVELELDHPLLGRRPVWK